MPSLDDNEFRSHINTIIDANRNKQLAIFVGAGVSKTSDTPDNRLSDWSELIKELKSDLNECKEQDYLKIAQLYYLTFGEHKYYNTIKKYFPDTIKPSIVHEIIFDLNPEIIITTNWDIALENTIKAQGCLYDIICSDKELTRSTLPQKLIKMHGDFQHHNFVFKEDDYINYSELFPLLENFIKGILATHIVVFLGYSYNDINIKHIVKWIQNHSDCRPPMFITVFEENQSQKRYLENYGIISLVLSEESSALPDLYSSKTKKLYWFLDILNKKDIGYKPSTEEDIINFVYDRVIILNDLENILFSQIKSVLTNCGIQFTQKLPVLVFYKDILSKDINEEIRNIYCRFINIIKDIIQNDNKAVFEKNKELKAVFEVFYKAGIKGISLNNDYNDGDFFNLDYCIFIDESVLFKNTINFKFNDTSFDSKNQLDEMTSRAFMLYQQEKHDETLTLLDEIISECRISKKWISLFIAMLNKNIMREQVKYYSFGKEYDKKYDLLKEYNLHEEYEKLPVDDKQAVEPIYNFLQFNELYKLFFDFSGDLETKKSQNETIKSGGSVFGSDGGKNSMQQENLLRFVIGNKIMVDNYEEYREIHKKILSIRFTEQALNKTINLNRMELYIAIKYCDYKYLKESLKECFSDVENETHKSLDISEDDKKWLADIVFSNLSEQYLNLKIIFSQVEEYLCNTIFIMSFIKFEKKEIDSVLSVLVKIIARSGNLITVYERIDLFLGLQYNLFHSDFNPQFFIEIFKAVMKKIITQEWNLHEMQSFTDRGLLRNIFGYAQNQQAVFDDTVIIQQIILEISNFDEIDKKKIISSILLNIYLIGTDVVKEIIKDFVLSIDNSINIDDSSPKVINFASVEDLTAYGQMQDNISTSILFEINLHIVGLKELTPVVIQTIESYLKQFEGNKSSNGYLNTIIDCVIKIYEKEQNESITHLYETAKRLNGENK